MNFFSRLLQLAGVQLSDEATQAELIRTARAFALPAYAHMRPSAPCTRDTGPVRLQATSSETQRVEIVFPYPCIVTGLHFVVTPATFGAFAVSLDDIHCQLDEFDAERSLTSVQGPSGTRVPQSLPLSSLDCRVREHMIALYRGSEPRLGFTYRSRYGSGGLPGDVLVSASAFVVPLAMV
jgi:hypothetical protein